MKDSKIIIKFSKKEKRSLYLQFLFIYSNNETNNIIEVDMTSYRFINFIKLSFFYEKHKINGNFKEINFFKLFFLKLKIRKFLREKKEDLKIYKEIVNILIGEKEMTNEIKKINIQNIDSKEKIITFLYKDKIEFALYYEYNKVNRIIIKKEELFNSNNDIIILRPDALGFKFNKNTYGEMNIENFYIRNIRNKEAFRYVKLLERV